MKKYSDYTEHLIKVSGGLCNFNKHYKMARYDGSNQLSLTKFVKILKTAEESLEKYKPKTEDGNISENIYFHFPNLFANYNYMYDDSNGIVITPLHNIIKSGKYNRLVKKALCKDMIFALFRTRHHEIICYLLIESLQVKYRGMNFGFSHRAYSILNHFFSLSSYLRYTNNITVDCLYTTHIAESLIELLFYYKKNGYFEKDMNLDSIIDEYIKLYNISRKIDVDWTTINKIKKVPQAMFYPDDLSEEESLDLLSTNPDYYMKIFIEDKVFNKIQDKDRLSEIISDYINKKFNRNPTSYSCKWILDNINDEQVLLHCMDKIKNKKITEHIVIKLIG